MINIKILIIILCVLLPGFPAIAISDDSESFNKMGNWYIHTVKPAPDETMAVTLMLDSDIGKSRFGEKITLMIFCKRNRTRMNINWGSYLGNDAFVAMKIGTEKEFSKFWNLSPDKRITHYPESPIRLIKQMMKHNDLVCKITPYNGDPIEASFKISGLKEAVLPLRKTCSW